MIVSKKLFQHKEIIHGFFNRNGGISKGIYKSLNCGIGSIDKRNSGEFDFASSNELWRASLDTLDFMPLALANYSGGIIVTDWYNDGDAINESVKISIRFLSNEVRSDALVIKVFYKNCSVQQSCKITDRSGSLSTELTNKLLTKAAIYEKQNKSKNKIKYINEALKDKSFKIESRTDTISKLLNKNGKSFGKIIIYFQLKLIGKRKNFIA